MFRRIEKSPVNNNSYYVSTFDVKSGYVNWKCETFQFFGKLDMVLCIFMGTK